MTNKDFINNFADGLQSDGTHGNLFVDSGVLYSYGKHYPLMWRSGGLWLINISGYSNTTERHISLAKQAVGYNYIPVKLKMGNVYRTDFDLSLTNALTSLQLSLKELQAVIDSKKRKNTWIYSNLVNQKQDLLGYIQTVNTAIDNQ